MYMGPSPSFGWTSTGICRSIRLKLLFKSASTTMGNSRPLDLWMLMICTPPEAHPAATDGCSPVSRRNRRWLTKPNSPLYPAPSKALACSYRAIRFSRRRSPLGMAPNTPRIFSRLYSSHISRCTLRSFARERSSPISPRNAWQSASPLASTAS